MAGADVSRPEATKACEPRRHRTDRSRHLTRGTLSVEDKVKRRMKIENFGGCLLLIAFGIALARVAAAGNACPPAKDPPARDLETASRSR